MNAKGWITGLILIPSLVAGCADQTAIDPSEESGKRVAVRQTPTVDREGAIEQPQQSPGLFQEPMTSPPAPTPVPVPHLIPPTSAPARLPQVSTGRPDPFASLAVTPTVSVSQAATPSNPPVTLSPVPNVPTVPVSALPSGGQPSTAFPPLPTLQPAPTDINQIPPISIPGNFTPPMRLADAIEISGVVEVGGKTSVIVQVPDERTSRYATVGEYLANGQVLIKRVEMGTEPVVILEEDGEEVIRYVGSGNSLAGAM